VIKIKQNYKSSVRLDEEFSVDNFVNSIVLHGTALNALEVLSKDISGSQQKCFTLTGPYGSGKSTIALFLSLLLSSDKNSRKAANDKLNSTSSNIEFEKSFNVKSGWKIIKHVCELENPAYSIAVAVSKSQTRQKVNEGLSDSEYLKLIESALNRNNKNDGTILLLDEMGKALDYQSRENKDLYFFQQLADIVQRTKQPVILIGFLHQSFSEYSRSMTAQVQREWAKVQGRYRDISYSPSIDESLVLVADTLHKDNDMQTSLEGKYDDITTIIGKGLSKRPEVIEHLKRALPIDPIVSLLLGPISKRSFSQNERSLFGFLASNEKLSFNQFVKEQYSNIEARQSLPLYDTELFWEYLTQNLDHVISSSRDSQAWLEAKDAVYRSTINGGRIHEVITKVIALVTLFGYQHQLFASKDVIKQYFQKFGYSLSSVKKAVQELQDWSVIIYRPNHAALTIFQGSDVDINELVFETIEQIKDGFDWTKKIDLQQHIMASAHYHKTGTMRWVQARIVSEKTVEDLSEVSAAAKDNEPFLHFIIPSSSSAESALQKTAKANHRIVQGNSKSIESLKTYALELSALSKIQRENKKIVHDRIAKEEINNRILATERLIEKELDTTFALAKWSYRGEVYSTLSLNSLASKLADKIYSESPIIINELVNRSKPSGSANAAIKKLILAMAEHHGMPELNFPMETFPAEKGLYFSCIKHFGLHGEEKGQFKFLPPKESKLAALFERTHQDLIVKSSSIVWLSEIDDFWSKQPFGLTKGVRSIWLMAFVLVHLKNYAFYDKNEATGETIFITAPDDEFALKLIQKPQNVAVQAVHIDQEKTAYLTKISEALDSVTTANKRYSENVSPLNVAEGLVTFYSGLSNWTLETNDILPKAKKFIEVTKKASDPHKYLFKTLPEILKTPVDAITQEQVQDLLLGLKNHHAEMVNRFEETLRIQIGDSMSVANSESVIKFTSDFKLKSFAQRLKDIEKSEGQWVSNIISLLSSKSERNWDDSAIRRAESELPGLVEKFKLAIHRARFKDRNIVSAVKNQFGKEFSGIQASIHDRTTDEQRSILIALLEELETKEHINET